MFVDHDGFKLLYGLVATTDFGDKLWLHHSTSVGDGVVEGDEVHRGDVDFVANRHPRQRHLRPELSSVFGLVVRVLDDGLRLTSYACPDFLVQAECIQSFDVFLRVGGEVLVDEDSRAFVGRLFDDFLHGANTALGKAVVVLHRAVRELDGTRADVHFVVEVHFFLTKQYDHRCDFEHGTRFVAFGQGHVIGFLIHTFFMVEPQVGQGFHIARFHIHEDGTALFRFVLGQGVVEGGFHYVLQLDVEGGDEVVAVLCFGVFFRADGHPVAMVDSSHEFAPILTFEVVVVSTFQAEIVALLFVGHAKHEAGEFFVGLVAAQFLLVDDAATVGTQSEDDELLHLAEVGLRDVQCNLIVAVLFSDAFGEESLPLGWGSLGQQLRHLNAERVDVFGQIGRVDGFIVEKDIVDGDGGGHQLTVA